MMENRLGAVRDPEAPFPLDRIMGVVLRVAFGIGFAISIRNTLDWWHRYQLNDPTLTYWGYLQRSWWMHGGYVTSIALWLTFGLANGRRWAFGSFMLVAIGGLGTSIHHRSALNVGLLTFELVYATMRLTGSLGVPPSWRPDPEDVPVRLDRYAGSLGLVLVGVSIGLYVISTLRGWHAAQSVGAVDLLGYLVRDWWSRIGYMAVALLEILATLAYLRSWHWAFVVLGILSVGWLFEAIHTGHPLYLASNAYTIAYCTGRLAWARFRLPILEREI